MPAPDRAQQRYERLRLSRALPQPDLSLRFLRDQFKRDIERPYKQLAAVTEAWDKLLPKELSGHTRLDGLTRGVLRVSVDSSARLFLLDLLLRQGLDRQIIAACKTGPALRKIQLRVAVMEQTARTTAPEEPST